MPRLASLSVGVCVCMWDGEIAWLAVWDDVRKFHVYILFPCSRSVVFLVSGVAWLLRGVVVAAGVRPGVSARSGLRVDLGLAVCALAGLHLGFFFGGGGLVLCWGTVLPRPAAGGVDQPSVFVVFGHYECRGLTAFGRPHWVTGF